MIKRRQEENISMWKNIDRNTDINIDSHIDKYICPNPFIGLPCRAPSLLKSQFTALGRHEHHSNLIDKQCCQLSNFVAKFSRLPYNLFFQKNLATNLAIFKLYLATFSNFR